MKMTALRSMRHTGRCKAPVMFLICAIGVHKSWRTVNNRLRTSTFGSMCNLLAFRPTKLKEGHAHPDIIVESALLACVSPPDITYKHHLQVLVMRDLSSSNHTKQYRACHAEENQLFLALATSIPNLKLFMFSCDLCLHWLQATPARTLEQFGKHSAGHCGGRPDLRCTA